MPVDIDAVVLSNTRLSDDYNVVALEAPDVAARAEPGQFVMVKPARGCDPLLRRPFSVFEILKDETGRPIGISLLNKRVGVGTRLIFDLTAGDRMACLGPLGRPFTPVTPPAHAWMIAGGVGLAPFATLAQALADRGTPAALFYGGRRRSEIFHLDFFQRLGTRVVATTEDGSFGERGLITQPLERALHEATASRLVLYACGPTAMMRAVSALGRVHGRPTQVSLEPVMGCGLGGCYSCVVKTRDDGQRAHYVRACLDGPVFDADKIVWEELAH